MRSLGAIGWALLASSAAEAPGVAKDPKPDPLPAPPRDRDPLPFGMADPSDDGGWRDFGGLSFGGKIAPPLPPLAGVPEKTLRRRERRGDPAAAEELHRRWRLAHPLPG